jgi:hypothetical protein
MYRIKIRKNGNDYGSIGPYQNKADALLDAAALKRPGLDVVVVSPPSGSGSGTVPTRANHPALVAAARTILPLVLPLITQKVQGRVDEFVAATPERQVEILRKVATFNPPARLFLSDDERAKALAALVAEQLGRHGKELVTVAASVATTAGGGKTATVKANRRRKGAGRRTGKVR